MRAHINLRFRPGLVIFVGESGRHIREQLQDIACFAQLDSVLYQSIALLEVDAGSDQATPFPLGPQFVEGASVQQEDTLARLIEDALKDVQANKRILEIIAAGYPVPNPRTQIYIVGDATEHWLAHVLQVVHHRLEKSGFNTLICYVLSAFKMMQHTGPLRAIGKTGPIVEETAAPTSAGGISDWSQRDLANYCYLYEDMLTYPVPTFVKEFESYHAAAEALFTLIATGLTTEPFFEEMMRLGSPFNTYENVGSLSTSLISFPRAALLEYCSARLGVALMGQWLCDLQVQTISENKRRELQQRARGVARDIESWIIDSEERPLANGEKRGSGKIEIIEECKWPNLNILIRQARQSKEDLPASNTALQEQRASGDDQARLHKKLEEETLSLFELFWSKEVEREYKRLRRPRFDAWTKLVYQQAGKAIEAYRDWERAARAAWEAASDRVSNNIRLVVDRLWSGDDSGFEQATIYVNELDAKLSRIADRQSHWREAHERDYEEYLNEVEHAARGPWTVDDDDTNIIDGVAGGPAQAGPTMGGRGAGIAASTAASAGGSGIIGTNTTIGGSHQHLPLREERLANQLEQRIHWLQDQIPEISTQSAVALPFILSLVLAMLASGVPATLPGIAMSAGIALLMVGILHLLFRLSHQKKVEEAKEDLLTFYRRYYAHLCEQREDLCRTVFMGPLRRRVQSMRDKLEDLQSFIKDIQSDLERRATQTQHRLFNSPGGVRDIFIANGERLQRDKKNTLEDFAGQVTKLRVKEPVAEWHQAPQDMKKQLIKMFRGQNESIMEMSAQRALEQIYRFATNVTQPYFKGPLVDLQLALDKEDIWREALDRAENPLYRARVGVREPQFRFICGRAPDISRGTRYIPNDAHPVHISYAHEWVLIAAFFRGGLPPALAVNTLFPHKVDVVTAPAPEDSDIKMDFTESGGLDDAAGSVLDDEDEISSIRRSTQ